MNRAVERVKEITGGAELASYPGNVSYRASVPVQAIPLLFPKNEVICAELREFTSVVCRPAPEEDSVPGFTVHGVDVYGAPADVVALTQRMEAVVEEWVEKKTIVGVVMWSDEQDPTAIVLKLVFNKQIVGVIIGKSGSNLARLQKEYAVEIRLANSPCYTAVDLECVVYITGAVAGILECVHALLGQMEKNAVERRLPVDTQLISLQRARDSFTALPAPRAALLPVVRVPCAYRQLHDEPNGATLRAAAALLLRRAGPAASAVRAARAAHAGVHGGEGLPGGGACGDRAAGGPLRERAGQAGRGDELHQGQHAVHHQHAEEGGGPAQRAAARDDGVGVAGGNREGRVGDAGEGEA